MATRTEQGPIAIHWEKVEAGDEQILPPRKQRELDDMPSVLALRAKQD